MSACSGTKPDARLKEMSHAVSGVNILNFIHLLSNTSERKLKISKSQEHFSHIQNHTYQFCLKESRHCQAKLRLDLKSGLVSQMTIMKNLWMELTFPQ